MTSTYVVTVETSAADDQDYKFVEERLGEEEVKVHDKLKRDDGTAIYWLDWQPHPERYIEDGEWVTPTASANTWDAAKSSIEHIRSTFAGAGLLVVECRVEEYELSKDDAKKTEAKAKKDRAAAEKALDQSK